MSGFASSSQKKQEASANIKKSLEKCQVLTASSLDYGNHTLTHLINHEETLNNVEELLDDNSAIIAESLRRLRGMTWTGMIYNAVSSISQPSVSNKNQPIDTSTIEIPPISTNPASVYDNQSECAVNTSSVLYPPTTPTHPTEEDKVIEDLARSVSSLHDMSVTIGVSLEASTKHIDRLDMKSEKLHDETLYASLRVSRLTASKASSAQIKPIGLFQFMTDEGLLASHGDRLVVTKNASRACIFSCYVKNQMIIGLRSETTLRYLGCTIWGSIAISGDYFGSQEECYVDLNGRRSGLLLMSRNFGGGGWLKIEGTGKNELDEVILGSTTSSVMDKEGMLYVMAIKCGDL